MIISSLEPKNRLLFLIYYYKSVNINDIIKYFNDTADIDNILQYLILDNTLQQNNNIYSINQYEKSNFLKIVNFFFNEMKIPISKSDLNKKFKMKNSKQIYQQLINSKCLETYVSDISRKIYVYPFHKKKEMIDSIKNIEYMNMKNSNDFDTHSKFIMINLGENIKEREGQIIDIDNIILNENEKRLIVNLYYDIKIRKLRIHGKKKEDIVTFYFNGNSPLAYNTIHSLIYKNIIRCSIFNYYYINNTIFLNLNNFYEKNKYLLD